MSPIPKQIKNKTIKQWAEHFGSSTSAIYSMIRRGNLESRIDGTYKRRHRKSRQYHGKTLDEWVELLGMSKQRTYYYGKMGVLRDIESGTYIVGNTKHLVRGKTLTYWAKQLGISRERARQLSNNGLLEARIDGEDTGRLYYINKRKIREQAVKSYNPKEKLSSFAKRHNISQTTAYVWLRSAGIKHITVKEQMKTQKYKKKTTDNNKCKTCKHFVRKENHYHMCNFGNFHMFGQSGTCKFHKEFIPIIPIVSDI